jgi:hypothetical protein
MRKLPALDEPRRTTAKKSTTIPATIVSFNIVAGIRGTVAAKR